MKELYTNKNQCCACSGCMSICPKKIIEMRTDEHGFQYPYVVNDSCIECNLCKKVCAFQSSDNRGSNPVKVYAAINKDFNVLSKSSSGGVFSAISKAVFKREGVVFGCAFNSKMEPEHIYIEKPEDLYKIQGSKYVKSNMNNSYLYVKRFLEEGRLVLFTGTPCQIDSLKVYLKKPYENLITADVICHGVTNVEIFKGYIKYLEEKFNCKVTDIKFRDKTKGWGHVEKITYVKKGRVREKYIYSFNSYYHMYFCTSQISADAVPSAFTVMADCGIVRFSSFGSLASQLSPHCTLALTGGINLTTLKNYLDCGIRLFITSAPYTH